jgi:hypothetical protein
MGKIDLSQLTGLIKRVGALRSYATMLWPGVIVLAGLLVLAAALLMGINLKQKVKKESIPMDAQVQSLLDSAPAIKQVEEERRYEDAYERDANLILRLSMQTTQRELLDYNIFPQPKDTSALLFTRFGNRFRQQVEGLIAQVKGGNCPSEEELQTSVQKVTGAGRGSPVGLPSTTGPSEESMITEQICQRRAEAASLYTSAEDISGYGFWSEYQYSNLEEGVKDCWFWQLGYWIIEDVFTTVEHLNAGSNSVNSSPVKRIMGIGFVTPDKLHAAGVKTPQDRPKYVTRPEEQLTVSLTGRLSNESIDVVHFSVVAVVSVNAVIPFMQELCSEKGHRFTGYTGENSAQSYKHNQISILESRVTAIRPEAPGHLRYRYGQEPVAEVELICEYLFNKKGYEPIYPEALKTRTGPTAGGV